MRVNKVIDLLEVNQPAYYIGTRELTYSNGIKLAKTYADFIKLDIEHGAFDMVGLGEFMKGLVEGGPTFSGHRTPAIIAELPIDGSSREMVLYNSWMIKQVLEQGVHGILLCHAECPEAVETLVEYTRYSFNGGRRGHGGQMTASRVWGVSEEEYLNKADVWPLNPVGELMLGIKLETPRTLHRAYETAKVVGISFGEWGPGDMGMSMGYPQQHDPPYPDDMLRNRDFVIKVCRDSGIYFLNQVHEDDVYEMLDRDDVMLCKASSEEVARMGRKYTKREMLYG
jgi:4-hydroxy-2-oxoheptanedioate aldolase